jgi:hypothetical protein
MRAKEEDAMRRFTRFVVLGAILVSGVTLKGGGWAVVTITQLPESMSAGAPINLVYAVRQHGVTLLSGLDGWVEATSGSARVSARAIPADRPGHYSATLTLPEAGDWSLIVHDGFTLHRGTPIVLSVSGPGRPPRPLSASESGERLFVAKGCVTCHAHGRILFAPPATIGPELTARRYAPGYLTTFLADPSRARSGRNGDLRMPDLDLRSDEIQSLVAFLNGGGDDRARASRP